VSVQLPTAWQQGSLLHTANVSRWPEAQQIAQAQTERKLVFSNFTARDEGKSRRLIARFEREEDARLGALAPEMLTDLIEAERMFRWYGDLHAAKPDAEKAARNYELADRLAATISKARGDT
jgi:hypothetical protein